MLVMEMETVKDTHKHSVSLVRLFIARGANAMMEMETVKDTQTYTKE